MLRGIVVTIGVGVMVLGGVLLAHGADKDDKDDRDERGNKKGHQAILNAVNGGNAQHGQLSDEITALSGGHQGILDAVNNGTSSSNTAHTNHDSDQTTQHNSLAGRATTHDAALTAHDGAQTSQHDAISQQISTTLSTGGDHSALPPAWDKALPANDPGGAACSSNSSRFTCIMSNAAVRDNETGLVWEQLLATTTHDWNNARIQCAGHATGGRKGWRLPSFAELASLVDPNNQGGNPDLPPGHPFTDVQSATYWSAATFAANPTFALNVNFSNGVVGFGDKANAGLAWCVRGGHNDGDAY